MKIARDEYYELRRDTFLFDQDWEHNHDKWIKRFSMVTDTHLAHAPKFIPAQSHSFATSQDADNVGWMHYSECSFECQGIHVTICRDTGYALLDAEEDHIADALFLVLRGRKIGGVYKDAEIVPFHHCISTGEGYVYRVHIADFRGLKHLVHRIAERIRLVLPEVIEKRRGQDA